MEVLENNLTVPLDAFIDRPLFCFLAQHSDAGARVEHVGVRGTATLEDRDLGRARALLETDCGPDEDAWDRVFEPDVSEDKALIRFEPETVVARDHSHERAPGRAATRGPPPPRAERKSLTDRRRSFGCEPGWPNGKAHAWKACSLPGFWVQIPVLA